VIIVSVRRSDTRVPLGKTANSSLVGPPCGQFFSARRKARVSGPFSVPASLLTEGGVVKFLASSFQGVLGDPAAMA